MRRVVLKWVGRCCLSTVTLAHTYLMPCLNVHHLLRDSGRKLPMKGNSFLPNKYKKLSSISATKIKTNKYTYILRYTWRISLKFKNTKKLKYNIWKNNKHVQIQQKSKKTQNYPQKRLTKNIQSTTNKYTLFITVTEKLEEHKTII